MTQPVPFHLRDFTPYLLNRAAETTSLDFQAHYKSRYGMLRTEWRVLFHLGRYGPLTAKAICDRAGIHKTKTSRAVTALEARRFVTRRTVEADRRHTLLTLTRAGAAVFDDLSAAAERYNAQLMAQFTKEEAATLRRVLLRMAAMDAGD
ncbi:MarR family winged helix-turn-helix transcriptional regulator [Jannaschia donghaensis]|uniref:Transcriptional regulator SlyA n=1 Tax=Jannaschia donghaensis TaxID=420998 RepID=A0A0M6YM62_9RHOB|nr:MarR family transcriptional regulator [Jannaschia donghaensis]CTQ51448.1 transcriptional regulator SlyA [Jannaschia donghaensis]